MNATCAARLRRLALAAAPIAVMAVFGDPATAMADTACGVPKLATGVMSCGFGNHA
jgi:hypothetical protein